MDTTVKSHEISDSLTLPCGAILKNRIAKAAMSENLGNPLHQSDEKLQRLYQTWASGGAGLLITGNVMIHAAALGEAHNVVFEKMLPQPKLKAWAEAGTQNATHLWVQINHPGKQSPKFLSAQPLAPSAIALKPPLSRFFNRPRALSEMEIYDLIERFGFAALTAKNAGFTGVQIHGAHGYLVSQFLSPLHNQRKDQWGGLLENRMRFVKEVYRSIRSQVGPNFPVSIKLNSADFQKGGFTQDESMEVVQTLSEQGMDLIEISGGTYEAPEMTGVTRKQKIAASTQIREAYFLEYCEKVRSRASCPLMLTGGFRSSAGMNAALKSGACDVVGLARSMAINPRFPTDLLMGKNAVSEVQFLSTGFKSLDRTFPLEILWYTDQLHRMAMGKAPDPNLSVLGAITRTLYSAGIQSLKRVRAK